MLYLPRLQRNILAANPRVTRFPVDFDNAGGAVDVSTPISVLPDASGPAAALKDAAASGEAIAAMEF